MKGANTDFKITLMVFLEKKSLRAIRPLWAKKWFTIVTLDLLKCFCFFLILHNGMGQEVHESYCNSFSEKLLQGNCTILCPKVMFHHNSCSTLRIFLKCCTMKGVKRCMKNIVMVFPKKVSIRAMWSFSAQNDTSS